MFGSKKTPSFVSQHARARLLSKLVFVFAVMAAAEAVLMLVCVAALQGAILVPAWVPTLAIAWRLPCYIAFFLVAWVFARFSTQVHRNVAALGRPVKEFSESSMGWWYFVPILNLVRPYQAMRAVWDASRSPAVMSSRETWSSAPEVSSWWTAWVISTVVWHISSNTAEKDEYLEIAVLLEVVSAGALIVAGFLLGNMARELADLQDYAWTEGE